MATLRASDKYVSLTEQERTILRAWHDHDGHAEVARSICLATQTVKNALQRVRGILGVRTTASAIVVAHRLGLVTIEDAGTG